MTILTAIGCAAAVLLSMLLCVLVLAWYTDTFDS